MSEQQAPSAWRPLIDAWAERERQLRPHQPVLPDRVFVRDAVEVGDHAYVLVSYEVDTPWPAEEDVTGAGNVPLTAVIQAERTRQPWMERDSTRSRTPWSNEDGTLHVAEHVLGVRRVYSGRVETGEHVGLYLDGAATPITATVVDGWFVAVASEDLPLRFVAIDGGEQIAMHRVDVMGMLPDPTFARPGADPMYFSPLDLRTVIPIVQWVRSGDVVVVATCIEQYDEGGMLRLRIDGTRADEDTFVTWPRVSLFVDGQELPSAVCGEYSLADTISLDIGFRPWLPAGTVELGIRVDGIRGAAGDIGTIDLDVVTK